MVYAIIVMSRVTDPDVFANAVARQISASRPCKGLGWSDRSDGVELGSIRSPTTSLRRPRSLRARCSRLVASPRPVNPHIRAPVRVPYRLHRGLEAGASGIGTSSGGWSDLLHPTRRHKRTADKRSHCSEHSAALAQASFMSPDPER